MVDEESRLGALRLLLDRSKNIGVFLLDQLALELERSDSGFAIHLMAAACSVYDRRSIPPTVSLLQRKDVELTFRIRCLNLLCELYQYSATPEIERKEVSLADNRGAMLSFASETDEYFNIFGEPLNDGDRNQIEMAVRGVAEDPEEIRVVRLEARSCLARIWRTKYRTNETYSIAF